MKKLSLSILIATLIFSIGLGTVYAADVAIVVASTALSTGTISISSTSLARQTAAISFTTSVNVYLAAAGSSATVSENYTATAGHLNGDKEYALASSGGGVRWIAKAAGSTTLTGAPAISTAGAVTWGTFAAM
jgi:hypothetical protein